MADRQEGLFGSVVESHYIYPSARFPYRTAELFKDSNLYQGMSQEFAKDFQKRLEDAFSDPDAYFGVYLEDNQPMGVVTLFLREEYVFVLALQVSSSFKYEAIANALLHNAEQKFKGKTFYSVIHKSNPMLDTYFKNGCSESPKFYEHEHPQWRKEDGWIGIIYPSLLKKKETHLSRINSLSKTKQAGKEAIQDLTGRSRPVFIIQDDAVVDVPEKWQFTEQIFTPLSAINELNKKLHCIGAVETSDGRLAGTCWLIRPGYVCTNKHVAALFKFNSEGSVVKTIESPLVNFKREHQRKDDPAHRFSVDSLVYVDKEVDLAILKLKDYPGNDYLVIEDAPFEQWKNLVEDEVFVVGYPERDKKRNPEALMVKIFGEVYNKKRLAYGKLTDYRRAEEFYHSASTLGGNSGSPVLGLHSMRVLGLHFGGLYNENNRCIGFPKLQEILQRLFPN